MIVFLYCDFDILICNCIVFYWMNGSVRLSLSVLIGFVSMCLRFVFVVLVLLVSVKVG